MSSRSCCVSLAAGQLCLPSCSPPRGGSEAPVTTVFLPGPGPGVRSSQDERMLP